MSFVPTVLIFLATLSVLVLAHELGHFATAKLAGIKVQEFGFGFPPRLFGMRRGETMYSFNLLPLGGFVKMLGENGEVMNPQAFASKGLRVRAAVLIAGSAMNLALAPLLMSAAFIVGAPEPCQTCESVRVQGLLPGGPGEHAGMREGDVIVAIDDLAVRTAEDIRRSVRANLGREIAVQVNRGGETEVLRLTPREVADERIGAVGMQLGPEYVVVQHPFSEAVPLGFRGIGVLLRTFPEGLRSLLLREAGAQLSGPIGIAWSTGHAASAGLNYLLAFVAFLSLNLAVFNMLPLPGLDGGRLLFLLIEAVRRGRRISPRFEGAVHLVGMALLLTLMAYASVHDLRRILAG